MILLHATRKLFERLPLKEDGQLAVTSRSEWLYAQATLVDNPLSGWHGNLVILQRRNCVLLVHDTTRFPLVLPALTKPDFAELNDRFVDAFMNTLLKCEAEDPQMDAAHHYLRPFQVDTHCNRSVQGTLNRMKEEIEHLLWYEQVDIADMMGYRLGAWLASMPRSVKNRGYLWPHKEMLGLLSGLANQGCNREAANDD